jgi:TM2 domain-containing membrane protein YozV
MKNDKDIKEQAIMDIMYNRTKKSMLIAYLLGAILGSFGLHWFYLGKHEYGAVSLGLLFLAMVIPASSVLMVIWTLAAVVYTYFVVNQVNAEILEEIEVLRGKEY